MTATKEKLTRTARRHLRSAILLRDAGVSEYEALTRLERAGKDKDYCPIFDGPHHTAEKPLVQEGQGRTNDLLVCAGCRADYRRAPCR